MVPGGEVRGDQGLMQAAVLSTAVKNGRKPLNPSYNFSHNGPVSTFDTELHSLDISTAEWHAGHPSFCRIKQNSLTHNTYKSFQVTSFDFVKKPSSQIYLPTAINARARFTGRLLIKRRLMTAL